MTCLALFTIFVLPGWHLDFVNELSVFTDQDTGLTFSFGNLDPLDFGVLTWTVFYFLTSSAPGFVPLPEVDPLFELLLMKC